MTPALLLFLALDSATDAALWPRFRAWGWGTPAYQALRFAAVRLPIIAAQAYLASRIAYVLGAPVLLAAVLTALLCLLLIWTACMDTLYHWFLRLFGGDDGPLLDGADHSHKGYILPRIAAVIVGDDVQDESEYRTGSVASGLAVLACALCIDALAVALPLL